MNGIFLHYFSQCVGYTKPTVRAIFHCYWFLKGAIYFFTQRVTTSSEKGNTHRLQFYSKFIAKRLIIKVIKLTQLLVTSAITNKQKIHITTKHKLRERRRILYTIVDVKRTPCLKIRSSLVAHEVNKHEKHTLNMVIFIIINLILRPKRCSSPQLNSTQFKQTKAKQTNSWSETEREYEQFHLAYTLYSICCAP